MARARNIKPSFFVDEDLVELSFSTRLLFIGLWTLADREGRLADKPKSIKMSVFPCDRVDVDKALNELQDAGFLVRYVVDGKGYIEIRNFVKHQKPHPNETASTLPEKPTFQPLVEVLQPKSDAIGSYLNSERGTLKDEKGVPPDATLSSIHSGTVITGIIKELGIAKLSSTQKRDWLNHSDLAFENGFSADEFIRCFADLRKRHDYPILPKYVTDRLPDFVKRNKTVEVLPTLDQKKADDAINSAALTLPPKPIAVGVVQ